MIRARHYLCEITPIFHSSNVIKQKTSILTVLLSILVIVAWMGCTAKRVQKGDVLLKKVIIKCDNSAISKDDVYGYLKQKPNRKLFGVNKPHLLKRGTIGRKNILVQGAGFPFYLAIYNLVNPKRELKRENRRDLRYQKKITRFTNNPKNKRGKNRKEPKKRRTFGEFLYAIGESPVIIDSSKTNRSVNQITSYLNNKGYFNSTVSDTLVYPLFQRNRHKKGILCYVLHPAPAYTIRSIAWDIQDENIAYDLLTDTAAEYCQLKIGANYDVDVFELERDRITKSLRNNGYFKFSKDYIHFSIDSTLGTHQVDVLIVIRKQQFQLNDTTWIETNHRRYAIRNIYVKSLFDLQQLRDDKDLSNYDTTFYREIFFLRNADSLDGLPIEKLLKFKPEVLSSRISFHKNLPYRQDDYEASYRQLTSLRVFRQVVIVPVEVANNELDIYVKLFPVAKQSFTAQLEGTTNSGSNFGIGGSYGYQNNNLFRGAEILQFNVKAGTEFQHTLSGTQQTNTTGIDFNTIQFGTEASLNIPREFFPFNYLVKKNRTEEKRTTQDRRTVFLASFNYQERPDYDRSLGNLSYGYTFRYKKYGRVSFFPIELNVVKVKPKEGLNDLLQNPDPLLHYRFTDHLIRDFRLTYLYNKENKKQTVLYFKVDGETSGLLMRPAFDLSNATTNSDGSYEIGGIPFSHYVRFLLEGKINKAVGDHQRLVGRALIGFGYPLKNFPTLPLEKSFYAGGANGIRAWEARTLGPGSYIIPAGQKYAQFGDIQLEYNLELRFKISSTLNGAVFMDGGNIWTLKADTARPNADFSFENLRFINDLAFGPGLGLRYDLSFFIIRLDWAIKLRDPSFPIGERWYIPGQRPLGSNLNFGIGYPF